MNNWQFSVPKGYFDDCVALAAQLPEGRLTTQPLFALTPRAYPSDDASSADQRPWARFTEHVKALNRESPGNVVYKIIFCTRHGQGYHNLKHDQVGAEEWDNHYSLLDGDGETTWFDAYLTPHGVAQAQALSEHWTASIAADGLPVPQALYTSPLARCLQTSQHLLKPVMDAHGAPYRPLVKEALRERWTMHTCDRRRPRAWIAENWPACAIEDGFAEEDRLGRLPRPETDAEHEARSLEALGDCFDRGERAAAAAAAGEDGEVVVSWTFHSQAMQSLLRALGAPSFHVQPATTIALLVRGERKSSG